MAGCYIRVLNGSQCIYYSLARLVSAKSRVPMDVPIKVYGVVKNAGNAVLDPRFCKQGTQVRRRHPGDMT